MASWATSSATLASYVFGGTPRYIAIGMLVVIGLILTLAPVVYVALERAQMLKVAAVLILFIVGAIVAVGADAWADAPQIITRPRIPVEALGFATLLGALAFAGACGGQNLPDTGAAARTGSHHHSAAHERVGRADHGPTRRDLSSRRRRRRTSGQPGVGAVDHAESAAGSDGAGCHAGSERCGHGGRGCRI